MDQHELQRYTFVELGHWVQLLTKRAITHTSKLRSPLDNRATLQVQGSNIKMDLENAQEYLDLMQAKLDEIKENI